jgi:hypothetical protein
MTCSVDTAPFDKFGSKLPWFGTLTVFRFIITHFDDIAMAQKINFAIIFCRGNTKETRGTAFVVYEDIYDAKNACDNLSGFHVLDRCAEREASSL